MKKLSVIHPFLFALFPILSLISHNIVEVSLSSISPRTLIFIFSFTFILLVLLSYIYKDGEKAALILSLFLFIFFSYGHFYNLIKGLEVGGLNIGRHTYLFPIFIIFFTIATHLILKMQQNLHNLTKIVNVVAVFLVVIPLIKIADYELKTRFSLRDIESPEKIAYYPVDSEEAAKFPDIYYIIFDRYAGASALKEFYNFDNSEFINYLLNKEFYVASESKANYPSTRLSLVSSLNMEYINYLSDRLGKNSTNTKPLSAKLQDYRVWRFLKSKGYKFIHFGSWTTGTIHNIYADKNVNLYFMVGLSRFLWRNCMLSPVASKLGFTESRQRWRTTLYKFEELTKIPDIKGPTFVFAHMMIPHTPFVFDRDGNFRKKLKPEEEMDEEHRKRLYINQLIFANKKIKDLIDKLLSKSEVPPIIILQADEGPYPIRFVQGRRTFKWKQASKAELRQKMSILNAYYLPDIDKDILYPSITPVNSFRVVFNLYFNTHFKLLPDENYGITRFYHKYDLFNITDKIKQDR